MENQTQESFDSENSSNQFESKPVALEQFKLTPQISEDLRTTPEILESTVEIDVTWSEKTEDGHTGKIDVITGTMTLDNKPFLGSKSVVETLLAKGKYASTFIDIEHGVVNAAEYTVDRNKNVKLRIYEKPLELFYESELVTKPEQRPETEPTQENLEGDLSFYENSTPESTGYKHAVRSLEKSSAVGDGRVVESSLVAKEIAQLSRETGIYIVANNDATPAGVSPTQSGTIDSPVESSLFETDQNPLRFAA